MATRILEMVGTFLVVTVVTFISWIPAEVLRSIRALLDSCMDRALFWESADPDRVGLSTVKNGKRSSSALR